MSDQSTAAAETWQPEPVTFHPSLKEFQRWSAFSLDPTPPPGGGKMVKGPAYHAICGTSLTSRIFNGKFGEYGCPECNERGYLIKPGEPLRNADEQPDEKARRE